MQIQAVCPPSAYVGCFIASVASCAFVAVTLRICLGYVLNFSWETAAIQYYRVSKHFKLKLNNII